MPNGHMPPALTGKVCPAFDLYGPVIDLPDLDTAAPGHSMHTDLA